MTRRRRELDLLSGKLCMMEGYSTVTGCARLVARRRDACRHYVNGALHEAIPKGSYIFRPEVDCPCDIVVSVRQHIPIL